MTVFQCIPFLPSEVRTLQKVQNLFSPMNNFPTRGTSEVEKLLLHKLCWINDIFVGIFIEVVNNSSLEYRTDFFNP